MIFHYVKKGRLPSEIYNAPEGEKMMLYTCMIMEFEELAKTGGACPLLAK